MLKKIFGELLKERRLNEQRDDKLLTQARLAEECECSTNSIGKLETGKQLPKLTTVFKLAAALNTTPEELVKVVRQRLSDGPIEP